MDEEPLLVFPAQSVAGMRLSSLSLLALILAAVGLAIGVTSDYARAQVDRDAQKAVVVPAFKYTHPDQIVDAYSHVAYRPWTLPARTQYGYATSEFNPSKSTLLSVGFRPPQYVKLLFGLDSQWFNPQLTLGLSVSLSHGPTLPSGFVRTFAANHGSDLTTVFSGQVTWPRWDIKDDETKFVARIPFQKPFPFDASKGRSLVLDVRTSSSTGTGYPDEWIYEAVGTPDGGILAKPNVPFWLSCHPGMVMRIT
jgi:hypothetical protein